MRQSRAPCEPGGSPVLWRPRANRTTLTAAKQSGLVRAIQADQPLLEERFEVARKDTIDSQTLLPPTRWGQLSPASNRSEHFGVKLDVQQGGRATAC